MEIRSINNFNIKVQESFQDTKRVIKYTIQWQKEKGHQSNNSLRNTTQKTKD